MAPGRGEEPNLLGNTDPGRLDAVRPLFGVSAIGESQKSAFPVYVRAGRFHVVVGCRPAPDLSHRSRGRAGQHSAERSAAEIVR